MKRHRVRARRVLAGAFAGGVVAALAGAGLLGAGTGAAAQTAAPAPTTKPASPGVSLVTQASSVPTRGVELLSLHLDDRAIAADPNAAVEITVHGAVGSRSEFDQAVQPSNAVLGSTRAQITVPFSHIAVNGRGDFLLAFGLTGSGASPSVPVDSAGVYPVEVGVVGTTRTHSPFVTWLVVVDHGNPSIPQPLRVSWIWRLEASPLTLTDGRADPTVLAQMRPGGRLDRIATLLRRARDFPLTLGLGPETLESWASRAATDTALARAVTRVERAAARSTTQLLPEPYVPIDGPAIEAEGLGSHVPGEYVAGSGTIERLTGAIPDPRTAFVDPIDEASLHRLSQMLVGRFILRDAALVPIPQPRTPDQPFTLATDAGVSAPAAATDSGVEQLLDGPGSPALRAQRVVAALAEIAYEAPSQARGIVLATPADWNPDVATVTDLLQALAADPLVRPATLDDLFADVAPDQRANAPLVRRVAPIAPAAELPLGAGEYETAARDLAAYETMVGARDPSIAQGRHALLVALSTSLTRDQALGELATIGNDLHDLTSGITTTAKTLTLTARRAKLPLSFQNDTRRAGVKIRVHLDSAKLIFPNGPDLVLTLPTGHTTVQFPVEARASGTFPMTITLESADGSLPLGPPTTVTIRSAVFSGIGIALTLGALLFLAGWWGNHFWRTRRNRRRAAAAPGTAP